MPLKLRNLFSWDKRLFLNYFESNNQKTSKPIDVMVIMNKEFHALNDEKLISVYHLEDKNKEKDLSIHIS